MQKDNPTGVLTQFAAALNISVTRQSISDELQKHPDYYSMLAFDDVLHNFGVGSAVYQVPFKDFADIPLPFICHLNDQTFALIKDRDEKRVIVSNEKWSRKKILIDDFAKLYNGSVLIAENKTHVAEINYDSKRKKEKLEDLRMPVAVSGLTITLAFFFLRYTGYINALNASNITLTFFKSLGLITCILLLVQSLDANNPLVQKLCGGKKNKNCNAILSSKAAGIGTISWSEIGFFYFAGTWLILLFNNNHLAIMQVLALLNIFSLPYTFYSIYYQWQVAKQWCIFCCTVQAILWIEFFSFIPYLYSFRTPSSTEIFTLITGLAIPVFAWLIAKPYFTKLIQIGPLNEQLRHFKYNKELFNGALKSHAKFAIPGDEWSILLGNVEAPNILTVVSNLYCEPCAKAHEQIEETLNNFDEMQIRIIFTGDYKNENNPKMKVYRHMMALNALRDKTIIKCALHDWYGQKHKNYTKWAEAYPVTFESENDDKLDKQLAWADVAQITGTPTLLLNGYRLPEAYQLKELKYMLN